MNFHKSKIFSQQLSLYNVHWVFFLYEKCSSTSYKIRNVFNCLRIVVQIAQRFMATNVIVFFFLRNMHNFWLKPLELLLCTFILKWNFLVEYLVWFELRVCSWKVMILFYLVRFCCMLHATCNNAIRYPCNRIFANTLNQIQIAAKRDREKH